MIRKALATVGLCTLLSSLGCQGEDLAPLCFARNSDGRCVEPASGLALKFDCSELPRAVAAANYEYILPSVRLPPGHRTTWSAQGLPEGLTMVDGGVIRGRPKRSGYYRDITVTMKDQSSNRTVQSKCGPLEVYEKLNLDLSKTAYGCIDPETDISQVISGGTGERLYCKVHTLPGAGEGCQHGLGNGYMPPGLSVKEDCSITGAIDRNVLEDGTFAWIVELRQSGAQRFVPFCATNRRNVKHKIEMLREGQKVDRRIPIHVEFAPNSSLRVGSESDPRAQVSAACENKSCDRRALQVHGSCSPLDYSVTQMLANVGEIRNASQAISGLVHGFNLHSGGQKMNELGLGERPWVLTLRSTYCTSPQVDQIPACDVDDSLQSQVAWSVIAWPKGDKAALPKI